MKETKIGCAKPGQPEKEADPQQPLPMKKEETKPMILVGKPAPDFTAEALFKNKFVEVSLSDYRGKWVYLCFYPGDFTFV